jgi:NAD(P)-dependent dehydrogenase (short-subunit alcohol dehydrogenase family)
MKLKDKITLITGTSPNIGGGIAEAFADEGAKVVCVDADADNARQCAKEILRRGGKAMGLVCDVTDEAQVKSAIDAARKEWGGIDVLVNGAAFYNMKGILAMTIDEFRRQVDVILGGTFLFTKHTATLMIEQKRRGAIIHLVSTEGHQGNPSNVAYCTAKSGLLNMTRANAVELAPYGIRVNSLTPTSTDPSESVERGVRWGRPSRDISDALPFKRAKLLPMQRAPSPSHYAKAAVFLASNDAEMITGTDLRVDAGAIARFWAFLPSAADNASPRR